MTQEAAAAGETRTISFHHTHTNEDLTVTYKVNGRYDEEALKRINYILRDWRKNEPIKMDPEVIDLLWEVHRETGSREPIWVVCGYRSPETNSMLRRRSSGVAQHSQHMLGKAIDFYIPGVSVEELRAAGLRAQRGGVGYYPSSNFVHLDTGGVRHWPRMPEAQLAKVLAKGQLASHNASDRSASRVTVAQADAARSSAPAAAASSMPSFLSKLFSGSDEHENDGEAAAAPATTASVEAPPAPAAPKIARAAMAARATGKSAAVSAAPEPRREKIGAIPTPTARPVKSETYQVASAGSPPVKSAGFEMASAASTPIQLERIQLAQAGVPAAVPSAKPGAAPAPVRPAQAASLVGHANMPANAASANDVINDRGYWQGLPPADPAETAQTTVTRPAPPARRTVREKVAAAELAPWPLRGSERTPSVGALSYAAAPSPAASRVGTGNTRAAPVAADNAAIVAMGADEQPPLVRKGPDTVQAGDRFNDPWIRAMMMAPSAQSFLHTTLYGSPDFRTLGPMFAKPASALAIKFAGDPTGGMSTERFSGSAIGFTPTVNFAPPRTASLR